MKNSVFGKTRKNVRNQKDMELVITDKRRNKLASEPNYHTTKHFSEKLFWRKVYSYFGNNGCVNKKAKGTKECVVNWEIKFDGYKMFLENTKAILRWQQRFKCKLHDGFKEMVNTTSISASDDNRIQIFDRGISYSYITCLGRVN